MATPNYAAGIYGTPPKPEFPGFPGSVDQFNAGYQLSYSGGDKDRLMGSEAYGSQDFPDFMRRGAPVGGLRAFKQSIPGAFDFSPIQQSFDTMQQGQMSAAKAAASSAARAATNRAMLSGGQVGSDFARASALQPFFRQQAAQNLDINQLRSQMAQNQAALTGQVTGQIAAMRQANRQSRQNYAVDAARLAQKNIGIGGSIGMGTGTGSDFLQDQLLNAQVDQTRRQEVKPGYLTNAAGLLPGSVNGQQMLNRVITGDLPNTRLY
jgi:hypothetical protein